MVEIKGNILDTFISTLIDHSVFRSYVAPKIVDIFKLGKVKHDKPWLVQLTIGTKQNVLEIVKECEVNLNGFPTKVNLKILHLGSYDVLLSMEWMEQHHVMLDCLHKSILCTDILGNQVKVQGIPNKVSLRPISTLQAKKYVRKGCKLFVVIIQDVEFDREKCIEVFPLLEEFKDVFPEEIPV